MDAYGFKDSQKTFSEWLAACDQLYKQKKEEQIANATLDEERISEYKANFWKGHKKSKTFLSFCISQGYYSIADDSSTKGRYIHQKNMFIAGDSMPTCRIAESDGAEISDIYDKILLRDLMLPGPRDQKCITNDIVSQLNQACDWLTKQNAKKESGVILFCGDVLIDRELYKSDCYVPSWKEENAFAFAGYYKNYPLIKMYDQNTPTACFAFDLKGWNGLKVRRDILESDIWGQLQISERTDDEIDEAIRQNKIKSLERNRVKGQCSIEYDLFWSLDKSSLPSKMVISLEKKDE
jgi:hypothetical protein